jgi:hypothetical protein
MKLYSFIFIFFFSIACVNAQKPERVEISGRVIIDTEEREGITVFNESSNKGTVTDEKGAFVIEVALNETIAFAALQFKDFTITIDERIIKSKQVTVQLVEEVNRLDEVIILPYDLSGNLDVDLNNVRTYNVDMDKVYLGIKDWDDYKFAADNKSKIENPLIENKLVNGLNFVNLFGLLVKSKDTDEVDKDKPKESPLTNRYSPQFLLTYFKIPTDSADVFIDFVESKNMHKTLLDKKKELLLLEHLLSESKLFLTAISEKQ